MQKNTKGYMYEENVARTKYGCSDVRYESGV